MSLKFQKRRQLAAFNQYEEEYEKLKSNIEFSCFENKCKTIVFTSANEKEGTTTTVTHLATSLAESGYNVLIIDTNIKKPMIHKMFKIKNSFGLSNVLTGQKEFNEVINQTEISRLKVLSTGPVPYSSEKLFRSVTFDSLLKKLSYEFDFILIDTSPVLVGNEAKIISSKCDGVVLVVRCGKTEDFIVLEAKKSLEVAKANLLGVILNKKPLGWMKKIRTFFTPSRSLLRN
ncbi:MAG: CpsD/CapB family tyrosine-protein kinase [Bacillaceae bacterium]|nr:CpsD/CapB family tyrosine-protein kinase [Bacillaceae bacterium]